MILPDDKLSPCKKTCKLNQKTGKCSSCNRTLEEITKWNSYSDNVKISIMKELEQRDS